MPAGVVRPIENRYCPEIQDKWKRTDYYYNESWQVLEERFGLEQTDKDDVATAVKVQWLWDMRYIDAPVLRWRDADGNSENGLEETLYFCNDANMNVTALAGRILAAKGVKRPKIGKRP
jgi:hypothetical protein